MARAGSSSADRRRRPSPRGRPAPGRPRLGRRALGGLAVAAAVLVAAAAAVVTVNRQVVRGSPLQARFTIVPPPLNSFNQLAISSDGRALLYATGPLLHLRRLDAVQPQPLPNTQGAYDPFFSPDGGWFGYFVGDELKKMRVTGGPPQTLARARRALGASWSPSGVIVFAPDRGATISRVPKPAASRWRFAARTSGRAGPRFAGLTCCRTGGAFSTLFAATTWTSRASTSATCPQPTPPPTAVCAADSNVFYGSGHLAFVRRGQLHAQPFDDVAGRALGPAFPSPSGSTRTLMTMGSRCSRCRPTACWSIAAA